MDARRWPIRASLALGLVLIPPIFADFTVNAADFVKAESSHGTTMWVDQEMGIFPLQPEWKIVRVKVRLSGGNESLQTYLVDFTHNRSALVEADGAQVPMEAWAWRSVVPEWK